MDTFGDMDTLGVMNAKDALGVMQRIKHIS